MSRDGDRREARFVTPRSSGISSAVWPVCERSHVATNWFAQQRRVFVMREVGPSYVQSYIFQCLRPLYPLLILALLVTGIVLAVLIFQYWVILFALAVIWSVLIVFMTRLVCDKFYSIALVKLDRKARSQWQGARPLPASPQFPETPMPATPLIRVLETIDLSTMDVEQFIEDEGKLQTSTQIAAVQKEQTRSVHMTPEDQDTI